ncbi:hypothetical protein MMC11_002940 [Xylographa trunciseda]|nr:hypothetical protein [Xylographa trunciseda]
MEGAVVDGVANQEINKLAGDAGVPSGMDGMVDKEADQFVGGNASTGGSTGLAQTGEDGMVNQGVNDVAGDMGIPGAADGVIDKEVDQEANKLL